MDFSTNVIVAVAIAAAVSSCARTDTMRLSQNEIMISTTAAPICGGEGAAYVAQKVAAIETLKSGYDKYIIMSAARANNTHVIQTPGTYNTYGNISPYGSFNATTTYTPGATIVAGSHDQQVAVRMFRTGEPGSERAISAKATLGPKWEKMVKSGVYTCSRG